MNHDLFCKSLIHNIKPYVIDEEMLLVKKKSDRKIEDPVVDPRESCKDWMHRVVMFRNSKKVERRYQEGFLFVNRIKHLIGMKKGAN